MINFEGKVAVVSGGGGGIGLAISEGFARAGAKIAVIDSSAERVSALQKSHPDALVVEGDVTSDKDVADFAAKVDETFGRADILVNNVGDFLMLAKPLAEFTKAEIQSLYNVNLGHVFSMTQAFIPLLEKAGPGSSITSFGSIEGYRGIPLCSAYAAFKAGLIGFTKSLALELGPQGIRVNMVAPETTNTIQVPVDMMIPEKHVDYKDKWIPLGRFGKPEDSAGAVFFLASDLAAWVTGTTIHVDGGALAAAGWYRDKNNIWTNMPVAAANGLGFGEE